jgi:hypothetical protein
MFEKHLTESLKRIFDLKKVTLSAPGESPEHECLFVDVETSRVKLSGGRAKVRATGRARLFGNADRMPLGFFQSQIEGSLNDDLKSFFFYDLEENASLFQNIAERSLSFVYFFDGQYDPDQGSLTSLEIEVT